MGFAEVLGEGGEGTNSERGIGGRDNAEVVGEGGGKVQLLTWGSKISWGSMKVRMPEVVSK